MPTHSGPAGAPPVVPASGAYLGAWVHPVEPERGTASFPVEQRSVPTVVAATGRPLGILHLYVGFAAPAPIAQLDAIRAAGSLPLLDWGCGPDVSSVAGGADDAQVTAFATALARWGHPVLLRWCWEMNLVHSHPQVGGPAAFTAAWKHLRALFAGAGASNVSFVWSPALTGVDPTPYFPGAAAVDWIGVDGYDRSGTETFVSLFGAFVARWVGQGRPLMVAETGSAGPSQPAYLASIGTGAPTLPQVKAVVYFDSPGPARDWSLTPAGLQAFAALARQPYFSPT